MCHGVNKIQKKTGNWGPGPWNSEITPKLGTVELWNYSEITPKLRNRGIPKLLRNCGMGPWNSEITPKLFRNYSETTPKLWNRDTPKLGNRGTIELLRNYSETGDRDRDRGTPKTVACYSPLLVLVCWSVSQDPPG